jgi:serine protease AprX
MGPRSAFDPRDLDRAIIAIPLAEAIEAERAEHAGRVDDATTPGTEKQSTDVALQIRPNVIVENGRYSVIIDLNTLYPGSVERARQRVLDLLQRVLRVGKDTPPDGRAMEIAAPRHLRRLSSSYLFAWLTADEIEMLVRLDNGWASAESVRANAERQQRPLCTEISARENRPRAPGDFSRRRAIFRIWPNHPVSPLLNRSVATVKGNAARATFGASGDGIVWAVIDSGIEGTHPHFKKHKNLELPNSLEHKDFSDGGAAGTGALVDRFGHGSHVAGIIAGEYVPASADPPSPPAAAKTFVRDERNQSVDRREHITEICGVAPRCKLVSYKVLNDAGQGDVTRIIAALEHIAQVNGDGRDIKIHGVNLSVGYPFDPRWFACGQSPICAVVDRLVRSGVVIVVAAGNTGYGYVDTVLAGQWAQGLPLSINDPGNADLAITVGSTHRDSPHLYGASYFSSKGPTGDGRLKPDLVAPGEKIISCFAQDSNKAKGPADPVYLYREESGTSMAAPHVSGAVAAFLSIRREFIGRSDFVKDVFLRSATDLKRDRSLQGSGLVDVLRALQSV